MRISWIWTALLLAAAASGCAGRQVVSPDVALRRVVLYRNGVGYFERAGTLEGDTLHFRVRREHVGDFLATLAVIDARGHARSVSFPSLEPAEGESDLVDVEVALGGGEDHELTVAYVVETPIWRPTYRVVMGEGDEALLQGWAVVQNVSGEDWADVSMSVTSGAPLSFRSDLGQPVIPVRPTVTDRGEVVVAPVYSETALAVATPTSEADDEAMPMEEQPDMDRFSSVTRGPVPVGASTGVPMAPAPEPGLRALARAEAGEAGWMAGDTTTVESELSEAPAPTPPAFTVSEAMRSVASLAAGAVHEGVTRYDVAEPVTVPEGGSTMVAIINRTVEGEDALLYRPDPSVPGSEVYPMRVVRLRNDSGVLLERGPVAIYQAGALLGQGLLDPLPDGATTSIPFAIERAVAVTVEHETEQTPARLIKIAGGRITVEEFNQRRVGFKVRNGADRDTTLYVRHERMPNWQVVDPPEGTEEVEGALLLPLHLRARSDGQLDVVERTPVRRVVDLMSDVAAEAVAVYLEGDAVDAAAGPVLREALEHRARLEEIDGRRRRLVEERQELRDAAEETRENLDTIRRIARARDLRDRLTRRLTDLTARIDGLTNQIVEIDAERSEMRVRLAEAIRDLTLDLDGHDDEGAAD